MGKEVCPFVWYELMTSDPAGAERFYRDVIGWSFKDSGLTDRRYSILSAGDTMIGGMMEIPEHARRMGARPTWLGYVGVPDVDAFTKRVTTSGGFLFQAPQDIPGIGRFSVVGDPHHATVILFRGATDDMPAPPPPGTPGHVGWHELHAGDREAAWAFYSKLFGWTDGGAIDIGPQARYQMFSTGSGENVGGILTREIEAPTAFWLYYFNVDSVQGAIERATRGGGKLLMGPHQVPGDLWIAILHDPQDVGFAVVSAKK